MESLLEVKNLVVGYDDIEIVKNVSLTVNKGEILGIVGESGCGKSTLLKSIIQLNGTGVHIKSGEIKYESMDLLKLSKEELRKVRGEKLGVIFQNPGDSLNPLRKIKDQFIETLQSHMKISAKEAYVKILDQLEKLNLMHGNRILNSYPYELSGGMNQRVAIALAMIMEPDLIVADEPTSALDASVQVQVVDEMMKLREKFGTAFVIVTHNMGVVAKMADKVGVMYHGEMVEYGSTKEVLADPAHPYTVALLDAIPKLNGGLPKGLPGCAPAFKLNECGCSFNTRCNTTTNKCGHYDYKLEKVGPNHYATCNCKDTDGVIAYG